MGRQLCIRGPASPYSIGGSVCGQTTRSCYCLRTRIEQTDHPHRHPSRPLRLYSSLCVEQWKFPVARPRLANEDIPHIIATIERNMNPRPEHYFRVTTNSRSTRYSHTMFLPKAHSLTPLSSPVGQKAICLTILDFFSETSRGRVPQPSPVPIPTLPTIKVICSLQKITVELGVPKTHPNHVGLRARVKLA